MNWYIVQAYSGFEKKVVDSIKDALSKKKLEANLEQILVPTHQVTEVKKGKRTKREKKYFPGYVLVKVNLSKEIYHLIKNIQKVSGFLGSGDQPTPISDKEIQRILGQVSESAINQKSGITFEIGEKVKVCDGPFASFNGLIEEIDEEKSRIKVSTNTLLIHGDLDQIVSPNFLLEAKDFFIRNNIEIQTHLIKNCDHHIPIEASSIALNYILKKI